MAKTAKSLKRPRPHITTATLRQLRVARMRRRAHKALRRKLHPHKGGPKKPKTKKRQFIKALQGTGGVLGAIANNLGVTYGTVRNLLSRPGWEDVRQEWEDERERGLDQAQTTVLDAMRQRLDIGTALRAAQWYLSRLRRQAFGDSVAVDQSTNIINSTVAASVANIAVPVQALGLPVDVMRQILEAMDKAAAQKEAEEALRGVGEPLRLPPALLPAVAALQASADEDEQEEGAA